MFDYLKPFNKVLVTGPSRSGTRICAKMIAYEIKHKYIDEGYFGSSDQTAFWKFMTFPESLVIQCPNMVRICHIAGANTEVAVVLMRRDVNDIIESQNNLRRFGSTKREFEAWNRQMLYYYGKTEGIISKIVYDYWDKVQKEKIINWFEIPYESLRGHPMFVKKEDRMKYFTGPGQTTVDSNEDDEYFIENTHKVRYRWTPSYEGEKVKI